MSETSEHERNTFAALEALHVRRESKVYSDEECAGNICDHDGPCFIEADAVCAHCADQTEPGDEWEHLVRPDAFWPCATIRALRMTLSLRGGHEAQ